MRPIITSFKILKILANYRLMTIWLAYVLIVLLGCKPNTELPATVSKSAECYRSPLINHEVGPWLLENGKKIRQTKELKVSLIRYSPNSLKCEVNLVHAETKISKKDSTEMAFISMLAWGVTPPGLERKASEAPQKFLSVKEFEWKPHKRYPIELAVLSTSPRIEPNFHVRAKTAYNTHYLHCTLPINRPPFSVTEFKADDLRGLCKLTVYTKNQSVAALLTISVKDLDDLDHIITETITILEKATT